MASVLTQTSSLMCLHHGKATLVPSQSKLKVAGAAVLLAGDPVGSMIVGCLTVPDATTPKIQCLTISSVEGGSAGKLKVGGKSVLLGTAAGNTSGTIGPTVQRWSVTGVQQSKLRAS